MSEPERAAAAAGAELSPIKRAIIEIRELRARLERLERDANEPIAVIGVGCRFPRADGPDAYWRVLRDGIDAISLVPRERWDVDAMFDPDPDAPGKVYTRHGGFLEAVDQFDAAFFGISPREAASLDPQHRLLLEVAWEALEHAGQSPDELLGTRTGVFVGICNNEYASLQLGSGAIAHVDAYFGTGNALSVAAGRLSYILGLRGPSVALDTACSSSLVAVHLACQSLRQNECRMAFAAGVNLMLRPEATINFCRARMLAPDGRCKSFDAGADGYARGEGAGVVLLKRLSHAVADGDRVLAVVLGSAVNQDGRSSGLTAPNGPSQEALLREALAKSGVEPAEVGYVEAHGTGTSLGDPIEMRALCSVLGEGRTAGQPLVVGSAKTNMGHLEAAAGVAGLIKVVLALQHETIPAHLHFSRMNPHIDLGSVPVEIPRAARAWPETSQRRVAGVSSFGFGGTNAHIVVAGAPPAAEATAALRPWQRVVVVSARTRSALGALAVQLADRLDSDRALNVDDVCYTLATGRAHLLTRAALDAETIGLLVRQLRALAGDSAASLQVVELASADPQPVAFTFHDGTDGDVGRLAALRAACPAFSAALDGVLPAMTDGFGADWPDAVRAGELAHEQTDRMRAATSFALQHAVAATLSHWGLEPAAVTGYGVTGLLVAASVAGALSVEDAARLLGARAGDPDGSDGDQMLARVRTHPPHTLLLAGGSGEPLSFAGGADVARWLDTAASAGDATLALPGYVTVAMRPDRQTGDAVVTALGLDPSRAAHDLSRAAGTCHANGAGVKWRVFYEGAKRRPVALPTYPFERQRHWTEAPAPSLTVDPARDHLSEAYAVLRADAAALRGLVIDAFAAERDELIVALVREQVSAVLRLGPAEAPDRRHRLIDLGLDSLMVVELRNRLEAALDLAGELPATLVFDHPTIEAIAAVLDRAVPTAVPDTLVRESKSPAAGLDDALERITELSDEDAEALLIERLGNL